MSQRLPGIVFGVWLGSDSGHAVIHSRISEADGPLHFEGVKYGEGMPAAQQLKAYSTWGEAFRSERGLGKIIELDELASFNGTAEGMVVPPSGCYQVKESSMFYSLINGMDGVVCEVNPDVEEPDKVVRPENALDASQVDSFLQTKVLDDKATHMSDAERSKLQQNLKGEWDQWPDDNDPQDPDADDDDVPEWPHQKKTDADARAEDRYQKRLERVTRYHVDLRPYVFPIIAKTVAQKLYGDAGCRRNTFTRVCPLGWKLVIDGIDSDETFPVDLLAAGGSIVCMPAADYQGVCNGSLDMTELLNRTDAAVRRMLQELSVLCWFEYPCATSPTKLWKECPVNYNKLVVGNTMWCMRKRDLGGRCSLILEFPLEGDEDEKAAWSNRCEEPWASTPLTEEQRVAYTSSYREIEDKQPNKLNHLRHMVPPDGKGPIDPQTGHPELLGQELSM